MSDLQQTTIIWALGFIVGFIVSFLSKKSIFNITINLIKDENNK